MEANVLQSLQFSTWVDLEKIGSNTSGNVRFSRGFRKSQKLQVLISAQLQPRRPPSSHHKKVSLEVSCSYNKLPASVIESGNFHAPFDEGLIVKNKSQEIKPYLSGRCIYLVGMMGSGKTTVGKILSEVLGYSFRDCDTLVEQEVGEVSVAEIFKLYGEDFFRDKETEALRELSLMQRLVVSTGGGAVVRPINWKYMHTGISIWLDVPLEALAQRIAAVGTNSRPLLHYELGDTYTKTFMLLSALFEERGDAYANANVRVSSEKIAAKMGQRAVLDLSPTDVAIEALEQIEGLLKGEDGLCAEF
ncbi:Shikimate kinase chloroplastic [Quillaja saponaria]|uniref:shikimate kinase n=1 Tax=Quillaja saponaria TaxID=32244 RepID=A0AAD7LGF2_QUISA|nr:Shikimate kinase chloroplastic [Quillaja saponaria]